MTPEEAWALMSGKPAPPVKSLSDIQNEQAMAAAQAPNPMMADPYNKELQTQMEPGWGGGPGGGFPGVAGMNKLAEKPMGTGERFVRTATKSKENFSQGPSTEISPGSPIDQVMSNAQKFMQTGGPQGPLADIITGALVPPQYKEHFNKRAIEGLNAQMGLTSAPFAVPLQMLDTATGGNIQPALEGGAGVMKRAAFNVIAPDKLGKSKRWGPQAEIEQEVFPKAETEPLQAIAKMGFDMLTDPTTYLLMGMGHGAMKGKGKVSIPKEAKTFADLTKKEAKQFPKERRLDKLTGAEPLNFGEKEIFKDRGPSSNVKPELETMTSEQLQALAKSKGPKTSEDIKAEEAASRAQQVKKAESQVPGDWGTGTEKTLPIPEEVGGEVVGEAMKGPKNNRLNRQKSTVAEEPSQTPRMLRGKVRIPEKRSAPPEEAAKVESEPPALEVDQKLSEAKEAGVAEEVTSEGKPRVPRKVTRMKKVKLRERKTSEEPVAPEQEAPKAEEAPKAGEHKYAKEMEEGAHADIDTSALDLNDPAVQDLVFMHKNDRIPGKGGKTFYQLWDEIPAIKHNDIIDRNLIEGREPHPYSEKKNKPSAGFDDLDKVKPSVELSDEKLSAMEDNSFDARLAALGPVKRGRKSAAEKQKDLRKQMENAKLMTQEEIDSYLKAPHVDTHPLADPELTARYNRVYTRDIEIDPTKRLTLLDEYKTLMKKDPNDLTPQQQSKVMGIYEAIKDAYKPVKKGEAHPPIDSVTKAIIDEQYAAYERELTSKGKGSEKTYGDPVTARIDTVKSISGPGTLLGHLDKEGLEKRLQRILHLQDRELRKTAEEYWDGLLHDHNVRDVPVMYDAADARVTQKRYLEQLHTLHTLKINSTAIRRELANYHKRPPKGEPFVTAATESVTSYPQESIPPGEVSNWAKSVEKNDDLSFWERGQRLRAELARQRKKQERSPGAKLEDVTEVENALNRLEHRAKAATPVIPDKTPAEGMNDFLEKNTSAGSLVKNHSALKKVVLYLIRSLDRNVRIAEVEGIDPIALYRSEGSIIDLYNVKDPFDRASLLVHEHAHLVEDNLGKANTSRGKYFKATLEKVLNDKKVLDWSEKFLENVKRMSAERGSLGDFNSELYATTMQHVFGKMRPELQYYGVKADPYIMDNLFSPLGTAIMRDMHELSKNPKAGKLLHNMANNVIPAGKLRRIRGKFERSAIERFENEVVPPDIESGNVTMGEISAATVQEMYDSITPPTKEKYSFMRGLYHGLADTISGNLSYGDKFAQFLRLLPLDLGARTFEKMIYAKDKDGNFVYKGKSADTARTAADLIRKISKDNVIVEDLGTAFNGHARRRIELIVKNTNKATIDKVMEVGYRESTKHKYEQSIQNIKSQLTPEEFKVWEALDAVKKDAYTIAKEAKKSMSQNRGFKNLFMDEPLVYEHRKIDPSQKVLRVLTSDGVMNAAGISKNMTEEWARLVTPVARMMMKYERWFDWRMVRDKNRFMEVAKSLLDKMGIDSVESLPQAWADHELSMLQHKRTLGNKYRRLIEDEKIRMMAQWRRDGMWKTAAEKKEFLKQANVREAFKAVRDKYSKQRFEEIKKIEMLPVDDIINNVVIDGVNHKLDLPSIRQAHNLKAQYLKRFHELEPKIPTEIGDRMSLTDEMEGTWGRYLEQKEAWEDFGKKLNRELKLAGNDHAKIKNVENIIDRMKLRVLKRLIPGKKDTELMAHTIAALGDVRAMDTSLNALSKMQLKERGHMVDVFSADKQKFVRDNWSEMHDEFRKTLKKDVKFDNIKDAHDTVDAMFTRKNTHYESDFSRSVSAGKTVDELKARTNSYLLYEFAEDYAQGQLDTAVDISKYITDNYIIENGRRTREELVGMNKDGELTNLINEVNAHINYTAGMGPRFALDSVAKKASEWYAKGKVSWNPSSHLVQFLQNLNTIAIYGPKHAYRGFSEAVKMWHGGKNLERINPELYADVKMAENLGLFSVKTLATSDVGVARAGVLTSSLKGINKLLNWAEARYSDVDAFNRFATMEAYKSMFKEEFNAAKNIALADKYKGGMINPFQMTQAERTALFNVVDGINAVQGNYGRSGVFPWLRNTTVNTLFGLLKRYDMNMTANDFVRLVDAKESALFKNKKWKDLQKEWETKPDNIINASQILPSIATQMITSGFRNFRGMSYANLVAGAAASGISLIPSVIEGFAKYFGNTEVEKSAQEVKENLQKWGNFQKQFDMMVAKYVESHNDVTGDLLTALYDGALSAVLGKNMNINIGARSESNILATSPIMDLFANSLAYTTNIGAGKEVIRSESAFKIISNLMPSIGNNFLQGLVYTRQALNLAEQKKGDLTDGERTLLGLVDAGLGAVSEHGLLHLTNSIPNMKVTDPDALMWYRGLLKFVGFSTVQGRNEGLIAMENTNAVRIHDDKERALRTEIQSWMINNQHMPKKELLQNLGKKLEHARKLGFPMTAKSVYNRFQNANSARMVLLHQIQRSKNDPGMVKKLVKNSVESGAMKNIILFELEKGTPEGNKNAKGLIKLTHSLVGKDLLKSFSSEELKDVRGFLSKKS